MYKSIFTTDVAVYTNWKTVNDVKRPLTGTGHRNESGARGGSDRDTGGGAAEEGCTHYPQSTSTWCAAQSTREHSRSAWPKPQSGSRSFRTVAKIVRLIPTQNIKGFSLGEAMVCPYLTAVDKWMWITNSTFPSSSRELFAVGDLLLGPRGGDPVRVWEGDWVGGRAPPLWDATRELCRRKDSQLQECLVSTSCWKNPRGAFLHL